MNTERFTVHHAQILDLLEVDGVVYRLHYDAEDIPTLTATEEDPITSTRCLVRIPVQPYTPVVQGAVR